MNIYQRLTLVQSNHKLHRTTSHVYQTLLSYCHQQKVTCFPAIKDIATLTNLGERCIQKQIRILEKEHLVETTPQTMPSGRKTSNLYTLVGLKEAQETEVVNTCRGERRFGSEALLLRGSHKKTYGGCSKESGDINPPKASDICNLEHLNQEIQSQNPPVAPIPSAPQLPAGHANALKTQETKPPVTPSPSAPSLRFEGELTTSKAIEIFNVFTRYGWIKRSFDSFFTFIANCSMVQRLRKKRKVQNLYGYLVWLYKGGMDRKLITAADERLAKEQIDLIRDMGQWPDFSEKQQAVQVQAPEPKITPAAPIRSSSRPAFDWHIKNLPEVGKEAALAKKVEYQQLTHVHPDWLKTMNCWVVKVKYVDGEKFYEEQKLTPDGWFEVTGTTSVVPLINSGNRRISQESFVQILVGGMRSPDLSQKV